MTAPFTQCAVTGHTAPMPGSALLGRARELQELFVALDEARAGSGSLAFVTGEPGIGKSKLCEEVAREAGRRGLHVAAGAAWEAGGAPPYWPWIQVLRTLIATRDASALDAPGLRARLAPLVSLMPELAAVLGNDAAPPAHDPEHARFLMLDAVAALVAHIARAQPVLCLFEDLHAADRPSIELLEFMSTQLPLHPVVIIATYRDSDAAQSENGPILNKLGARARTMALRRLRKHEVASHLEQESGEPADDALVSAVYEATEGNPLFVVETTRLLLQRGKEAGVALPGSVRAVIRERLGRVAPATRDACEMASVIGREFRRATLAAMSGRSAIALAVPLADAIDAAVLIETAPGDYRFTHILLRDVLYADLDRERREQLHVALASALRKGGASLAEIAHHELEGGEAARAAAIETARAAGRAALAQFAFAEAARWFRAALDSGSASTTTDPEAQARLHIELGRTLLQAGNSDAGHAACSEAARLARAAESPSLLAEAALALGSVFVIASVDARLVALLEEAAAGLGETDLGLRARVLARLAAAMQPAQDPSQPVALAQHAVELAHKYGDPATLLEVVRASASAMMDLVDTSQYIALHRDHVALAEQLGERPEALRGMLRLVLADVALGDIEQARSMLARAETAADALAHPHYTWRVSALRAAEAAFLGDFPRAYAILVRAHELARVSGDPNVETSLLVLRCAILRTQGRGDEACAAVQAAAAAVPRMVRGAVQVLIDSVAVRAQRTALPRDASSVDIVIALGDRTLLEHAAEICAALGDVERARRLLPLFGSEGFEHGGMYAMSWDGPLARALALLHATLGDTERARECFEQALDQTRRVGARAHEAWTCWDLQRFLHERDPHAAAVHRARAATLARELDMPDLIAMTEATDSVPVRAPETPVVLRMQQDGDVWLLSFGERSFRIKDGKGVRILDALLRVPGREHHVFDLAVPGGGVDTGDAGEVLDVQARVQYRARIERLRAELGEAEANHDLGRAERHRDELDQLTQELARAIGLSGRERRSGAAVERARVNVQRRVRDALKRIEELDSELGRHLNRAVKTGTFCSYDP
jgi:predicted ATPase